MEDDQPCLFFEMRIGQLIALKVALLLLKDLGIAMRAKRFEMVEEWNRCHPTRNRRVGILEKLENIVAVF